MMGGPNPQAGLGLLVELPDGECSHDSNDSIDGIGCKAVVRYKLRERRGTPPFGMQLFARRKWLLRLLMRRFRWRILVRRLLSLLLSLLLLRVALLGFLGLLLVALFDLLPLCFIGILLRQALVVLLLLLLELLMILLLLLVKLVLLLPVFLIAFGIASVGRRRPIMRRDFLGVSVGRTIGSVSWIVSRIDS